MNFPRSALLMVLLTATLCVSDEISLTCPDTVRRELKDISNIYSCTPYFFPAQNLAKCDGAVVLSSPVSAGNLTARVTLSFMVLMKVPEGTDMCLGLQKMYVIITQEIGDILSYSFGFNPLLTVGILTADDNTSKTSRSCSISLLSDVLNLTIFSNFTVWKYDAWNFSSHLLGTQLKWIQSLSITYKVKQELVKFPIFWPEKLQNTSIQKLHVGDSIDASKAVLLKDMPFIREIYFDGADVTKFHEDSFRGMPEMEVLKIHRSILTGIPPMIDRMPKLKILEIVDGDDTTMNFTIPTKVLSNLKNLEVLNLKNNQFDKISGRIPPLPNLKFLNLKGCLLPTIEENDFVGFPMLLQLSLSQNLLSDLKENTFRPLKRLMILDLSFGKLRNWPVLYDLSLLLLDMSGNLLSNVYNLGNTRTTVGILNISYNRILEWDDKYVFSRQKSLISNDDQRSKRSTSYSGSSNKKNIPTSGSPRTNHSFKVMELSTAQRAELSIPLHSRSQRKTSYPVPENLSLVKSDNSTKIIVKNFENTIESDSLLKYGFWVTRIDLSHNLFSGLSETMIQSLDGISQVDLGGNEFDCVDCRMIPFQKWLNTTSTKVINLGNFGPLLCHSPLSRRGTPVNVVQYDEEPCLEKIRTTSLLTLIGVPVGVISTLFVAAAAVIYKFRSQISYMLHLYRIRRRAMAFSQSAFNKYAFDAFICYSSKDSRFVLTWLAPLLEKGEEQYCICIHERDFPLGSHIVTNIVGSIHHSRKTIIVLSEHFINSKWCQWELEMAKHKMLNEDEHFLIVIQLEKLDRNSLPGHLQFLMDIRPYLEWPSSPGQNDEKELKRLKTALGPSIFQKTNERAPLRSDVMEDY